MKMRKCPKCKSYTLRETCPLCKIPTKIPAPPRFSPVDRFGRWRRKAY